MNGNASMPKIWYVKQQNQVYGPYGSSKLRSMALNDEIQPSSQISNYEDGPWKHAERLKGLEFSAPPPPKTNQQSESPSGVQTIQLTAKKIKVIYAIGIIVGFIGFAVLMGGGLLESGLLAITGGLLFLGGIVVASYAKLQQWWNHG